MEKKIDVKKKNYARNWNGLLPILVIESRYNVLYHDMHRWGMQQGGATRPHNTAWKGHDTVSPRAGACGNAHEQPSLGGGGGGGGESTYKKIVSWLGDDSWCCDTAQPRAAIQLSSAPQYGAGGCDKRGSTPNTKRSAREAGNCVTIQFCVMTEGSCDTALQRVHARSDKVGHACDTTGRVPRYGPARAMTLRTKPGPWVCTLCT